MTTYAQPPSWVWRGQTYTVVLTVNVSLSGSLGENESVRQSLFFTRIFLWVSGPCQFWQHVSVSLSSFSLTFRKKKNILYYFRSWINFCICCVDERLLLTTYFGRFLNTLKFDLFLGKTLFNIFSINITRQVETDWRTSTDKTKNSSKLGPDWYIGVPILLVDFSFLQMYQYQCICSSPCTKTETVS